MRQRRTYFVYTDCSDKGSDQMARKRRLTAALASNQNILYVPSECYLHSFHSAVKDGLQLLDDVIPALFEPATLGGFRKYFSSLAKLVNTWREQASEVMAAWEEYHETRARDCEHPPSIEELHSLLALGRRYPHQIVAGRWGSVEDAEQFLQERGRQNIVPVLMQVLSKSMKASGTSP